MISYSGLLQRTAIRGMLDVLGILQRKGTTMPAYPERICSLVERSEILGLQDFYALEERLYGPIVDTEGSWRMELVAKAETGKSSARPKSPI